MTLYDSIDDALNQWASSHGLVLQREWDERPARFCYTSVGQQCLQIQIAAPVDGRVQINLWDTEMINDREIHEIIEGAEANIAALLEQALSRARNILATELTQQRPE